MNYFQIRPEVAGADGDHMVTGVLAKTTSASMTA